MLSEQGRLHYKPSDKSYMKPLKNAFETLFSYVLPGLVHDESDLILLTRSRDIALTWVMMTQAPGPRSLTSVLGPSASEGGGVRHGLGGAGIMSLPPV